MVYTIDRTMYDLSLEIILGLGWKCSTIQKIVQFFFFWGSPYHMCSKYASSLVITKKSVVHCLLIMKFRVCNWTKGVPTSFVPSSYTFSYELAFEVEIGFAISKRLYGILNILEYETWCSCVRGCLYSCACIDASVFVDACAHVHVFERWALSELRTLQKKLFKLIQIVIFLWNSFSLKWIRLII